MALSYLDRAWRDGFWGREPASACASYMDAYCAGLRKGDRTRARLVACTPTAIASAVSLAPAAGACDDGPAVGRTLTSDEAT